MRATIKKYNQEYFQNIQSQMGCESTSEALNHLLLDLKRRGYSFLNDVTYNHQPITLSLPQIEEDIEVIEVDPVIKKMAALLEDF
jgi:hypothetical protein